jgi:hypothetical protein
MTTGHQKKQQRKLLSGEYEMATAESAGASTNFVSHVEPDTEPL